MSYSAAATLQDKWPLFVKYGATKPCVYQSMHEANYSGGSVTKPIKSSHNIDTVMDALGGGMQKYFESTSDGETVKSIDRVAIFPVMSLPVEPKVYDLIVDPSLTEWEVKGIAGDPMSAHWELWIRPIK